MEKFYVVITACYMHSLSTSIVLVNRKYDYASLHVS